MGNAAVESPAAYVLAGRYHDLVEQIIDAMEPEHDYLALELLKYSERIVGNVGAAEAPYAVDRRREHYRMAFRACCGSAAACDMVYRLRIGPREPSRLARQTLASLASMIRPIAEEGTEPRTDEEEAVLDGMFGLLDTDDLEPWEEEDGDEEW